MRLKKEYAYVSQHDGPQSFAAIAARQKMKQVTSGFIYINGKMEMVEEDHPRMETFLDTVDDLDDTSQFLVWTIYREEIEQIVRKLTEQGITCVEYHGGVKDAEREAAVDDFQAGKYRAFVCNKAA